MQRQRELSISERIRGKELKLNSKSVNVLVVDDQDDIRRMLSRLLAKVGVDHVAESATGEEAITYVAENDVDVVVMDIQMPGMGGIEATAAIKEARPDIIIFGFTAWPEAEQRSMLAAGATAVFDKVDMQPLLDAVINSGDPPDTSYSVEPPHR